MNIKSPILNELEALAPALINVPRTLPYSAQNGYFDGLAYDILNKIKAEDNLPTISFSIEDVVISTPYLVPTGYFESLADVILERLVVEENIVLDFKLPAIPTNPYIVSSDYFDNFSTQMLEKVGLLNFEDIVNDNKITPYQVPVDYFNDFTNEVWKKINSFENDTEQSSYIFSNINPYQIPVGYFNTLPNEILTRVKFLENKTVESNYNFSKINPYKIQIDYFEGLADEILLKLNGIKTQDVPEGYFASLPTMILQKIRGLEVENELKEVAPLLNTISKAPINHVPVGYFDALAPVSPTVETAPVKVIGISKKVNWFKNAIAACLIGTLGFTAYQLMDSSSKPATIINAGFQEIVPIKIPSNINVDEELTKVDDAALTSYLNNIEMPTEQATAHFNDINSGDVDAALSDISDEAIQKHLDETGSLSDKKN